MRDVLYGVLTIEEVLPYVGEWVRLRNRVRISRWRRLNPEKVRAQRMRYNARRRLGV